MVCFPNAKINIGLNIVAKRNDGFHNLETVFYPIQLSDILEFVPTNHKTTSIKTTGITLDVSDKENICYKAYELLAKHFELPPVKIFLHKIIPSGAGLGGGSADAAFLIKELNSFLKLGLKNNELEVMATKLGSDCAFFIQNKAVFAHGKGELFENLVLDLSSYYIYLVKPEVFISTAEAYAGIHPKTPKIPLRELIKKPIEQWRNTVENDFETSIFKKYPLLKEIKLSLYEQGAAYAAMSGSGSSIYGIFKKQPEKNQKFKRFFNWISPL